jgi:colanic acid/amylovoran biosynthesis glycosyltransferase
MPPVPAPFPKVLHLFNVFGALTERAMFDYTMGLSQSGFNLTIGYETLADESPRVGLPLTKLRRIEVQPTDDVAGQMREIAARSGCTLAPSPGNPGEGRGGGYSKTSAKPAQHILQKNNPHPNPPPEYRERGIKGDRVGTSGHCAMDRGADDPAMRGLLSENFQLVHGHFGPRLLQGAAWIARGVPMIVSLYGYDMGRLLRDPSWIQRYRWAAERGVLFVVLAHFMERRLLELAIPAKQVRCITLGINLDEHPFEPRPAPSKPRFVFIGRFVEKKGVSLLLQAMARLMQQGLDAHLDLIGGGPLEESLRAQTHTLGLEGNVRFAGTVPFAALFDHLRDCTALVQPSMVAGDGDAEGAPMVLMTAQAIGVPCITTHHSGNPETIPPIGQKFVMPERDTEALAAAMVEMIELPAADRSNLQIESRSWIEQYYNLRHTVDQYAALYREMMDC